jgi:hypothetical protein
MEQYIINKERSVRFVKSNDKNQFWRVYLLENHPLYAGEDDVMGGLIDNPDNISWDSWIFPDVIVAESKITNGTRIAGKFSIRDSTLSNIVFKNAQSENTNQVENIIYNSTLNFYAPMEIYVRGFVLIGSSFVDGFIDISNVDDKLILKNSCLTGNIDLSDCYDSLELVDCLFNGNLIFKDVDSWNPDQRWEGVKIEGNELVDKMM